MPVLVTGATGNVGRPVVAALLARGIPVRAAAATVQEVSDAFGDTVEPCALDFTDSTTWKAAYDGVEVMFLMRPPHLGKPNTQMVPSLECAKALGVRHMVLLSLQGAETNKVVPHAKLEAWLRASGLAWTFVRPSFFMSNLTGTHRSDIRDRDELVLPAGRGRTAFVDTTDIAAVAVEALAHPEAHRNVAWTPTGPESLTYGEVAVQLGEVLGRPIRYRAVNPLTYARHAHAALGLSWGMVGVTTAIYLVARFGKASGLTDDVRTVTGREPVTFRAFAERERGAWVR